MVTSNPATYRSLQELMNHLLKLPLVIHSSFINHLSAGIQNVSKSYFFHLRLPALVYLRSHRGGVLSNYMNFILFTGGKIFILPENSFLRTYILKKKKNYTRKNIFPNLVLPVVTELSLCYIYLSQKWMELKLRLEVAERGIV